MPFDPTTRLFQDLVGRLASEQVAVRDPNFRRKIGTLDVHVRWVLVLEEHQELEAAKPPVSGIRAPAIALLYRAIFALVQAGQIPMETYPDFHLEPCTGLSGPRGAPDEGRGQDFAPDAPGGRLARDRRTAARARHRADRHLRRCRRLSVWIAQRRAMTLLRGHGVEGAP